MICWQESGGRTRLCSHVNRVRWNLKLTQDLKASSLEAAPCTVYDEQEALTDTNDGAIVLVVVGCSHCERRREQASEEC